MTATLNGLSLSIGVWYFISVRAYNKAGLYSTQSSDGFLVDTIIPKAGVVNDGLGMLTFSVSVLFFKSFLQWRMLIFSKKLVCLCQ